MNVWKIKTESPDEQQLNEMRKLLLEGQVLVLPTDTIYGLHAVATNPSAVDRIFELKGRSSEKSLPVLASSVDQLRDLGVELSVRQRSFLENIWPAPLTAIVPLARPLPAAEGPTVAVRIPALLWLRRFIASTGPLASTSANKSGEPPAHDPSSLSNEIAAGVGGIADAGVLRRAASTIVDFTTDPPRVVRPGDFFFTQNLWKSMWKTL